MAIIDKKITSPINVIKNLSRKPTPSETMTYQELQAKFDEAPELLRLSLNGLVDDVVSHVDSSTIHTSSAEKALWNLPRVGVTTSALTYYVNTSSGNDNYNGTTSGTAFKTIGKISSVLPQVINHTVTVSVADGTYNESVNLYGYLGSGSINIVGNITTPANVKINDIALYDCKCSTSVKGFTGLSTTVSTFRFYSCTNFSIQSCASTSTGVGQSTVYVSRCVGFITSCICSNKYYGICIDNQSHVMLNNNSGSGNGIGISSNNGSIVSLQGTQPSGTTSIENATGGRILSDINAPNLNIPGYKYNDDGTIEQWGILDISANTNSKVLNFPIAFPNKTLSISLVNIYVNSTKIIYSLGSLEPLYTTVYPIDTTTNAVPTVGVRFYWRAIGY